MTSKEIGIIKIKTALAVSLEDFWSELFKVHMQTLSCDHAELRQLSSELGEVLEKIEEIQNKFLGPVKI